MQFPTYRTDAKRILLTACWHMGTANHDGEALDKIMGKVKRMPWLMLGDLVDGIMPGDKRHSVDEHKASITDQMNEATEALERGAKTCIGVIAGNHDIKAGRIIGDLFPCVCKNAGVPYFGAMAMLDLVFPKGSCLAMLHHGRGSMGYNSGNPERDEANRERKLRLNYNKWSFDALFSAHHHKTVISPATYLPRGVRDNDKLKRIPELHYSEWMMAAPSLYRNYDNEVSTNYAEAAGFPPTDIGWLEVCFARDGKIEAVEEYDGNGKVISVTQARYLRG